MKTISKVHKLLNGHVALDFEDGTTQIVHRGNHEAHGPKPGDTWPPEPEKEETNVETQSSDTPELAQE